MVLDFLLERSVYLQADSEEGQAACDALGVEVLPTVQFWRDGKKLWEHRGIVQLEQDLGEGNWLPLLDLLKADLEGPD